jgi:hypothetical protein
MNWILNLELPCIGKVEQWSRHYPNRCDPPGAGWRQGVRYHRVPPGDVRNRVWIHVEFFSFSNFERFLVRLPHFAIDMSRMSACRQVSTGLSGQGSLAIRTPRSPAYPRLSFSSASTLSLIKPQSFSHSLTCLSLVVFRTLTFS